MSELGPFSPPSLARRMVLGAVTNNPYFRMAQGTAQFLNSPYGRRMGGRVFRAVKRNYQNRKRKARNISDREGLGVDPTFGSSQKELIANGEPVLHDVRSVYSINLTAINKATGASEINARNRQTIHIKGFALYAIFRNLSGSASSGSQNITCNFAIVSPRNQNSDPPSLSGFFRDYNTSRDVDWSTGLNNNQIHTYPISTDKWRVLMHKRLMLGARTSYSTGVTTGTYLRDHTWNSVQPSQMAKKFWVPLNTTVTFNDDSTDECESKVFLIYWFDILGNPSGAVSVANQISGGVRCVTYFTEVPTPPPKRYTMGSSKMMKIS